MGTLKYKGYTGSVEYSEEDNCLYTNSVRYAVSDSGDMRSLVFQVFLRLQS